MQSYAKIPNRQPPPRNRIAGRRLPEYGNVLFRYVPAAAVAYLFFFLYLCKDHLAKQSRNGVIERASRTPAELLAPAHQQIVIVSHTNPDGDAVGSSLAWAEALRSMGHEVTCVVPNKYPYFLDWMQGIEEVVVFKNDTEGRAARAIAGADILFCLDFNAVSRLEILSETIGANTTARRVLIDHHLSPDGGF